MLHGNCQHDLQQLNREEAALHSLTDNCIDAAAEKRFSDFQGHV